MNTANCVWKRTIVAFSVACVLFSAPAVYGGDELEFKTLLVFGRWRVFFIGSSSLSDFPAFTADGKPIEPLPESLREFRPARLHGTKTRDRIVELFFQPPGSKTLEDADLVDLGQCTELESLILESSHLTDAACLHLPKLKRLKKLAIRGGVITDVGLQRLSKIGSIEVLEVADSAITDSGLEHLRQLSRLRSLDVSGTKITDRGLEVISGFPALRELDIARTAITEEGLGRLPKGLDWLWIENLPMTEVGCAHLSRLTELQVLVLADTRLGDDSLAHLAKLHKLNDLTLRGNPISGKGLKHLHGLRKLRLLGLGKTSVTEDDAVELQDAMPHLFMIMGIDESRAQAEGLVRAGLAMDPEHTSMALRNCGKVEGGVPERRE